MDVCIHYSIGALQSLFVLIPVGTGENASPVHTLSSALCHSVFHSPYGVALPPCPPVAQNPTILFHTETAAADFWFLILAQPPPTRQLWERDNGFLFDGP